VAQSKRAWVLMEALEHKRNVPAAGLPALRVCLFLAVSLSSAPAARLRALAAALAIELPVWRVVLSAGLCVAVFCVFTVLTVCYVAAVVGDALFIPGGYFNKLRTYRPGERWDVAQTAAVCALCSFFPHCSC
jgi:hypothetical protein